MSHYLLKNHLEMFYFKLLAIHKKGIEYMIRKTKEELYEKISHSWAYWIRTSDAGVKFLCLTAWRMPNILREEVTAYNSHIFIWVEFHIDNKNELNRSDKSQINDSNVYFSLSTRMCYHYTNLHFF